MTLRETIKAINILRTNLLEEVEWLREVKIEEPGIPECLGRIKEIVVELEQIYDGGTGTKPESTS